MIDIRRISENKKDFLDLLLLADEQEDMIDRYLERGEMFALYAEDELKSIAVVTQEDQDTCELKSIATYPQYQGRGYGKKLLNYLSEYYKTRYKFMLVGTGDCPAIILFYEYCGFSKSHRVKNFFIDHYDHPILEAGQQLVDMVYLKRNL